MSICLRDKKPSELMKQRRQRRASHVKSWLSPLQQKAEREVRMLSSEQSTAIAAATKKQLSMRTALKPDASQQASTRAARAEFEATRIQLAGWRTHWPVDSASVNEDSAGGRRRRGRIRKQGTNCRLFRAKAIARVGSALTARIDRLTVTGAQKRCSEWQSRMLSQYREIDAVNLLEQGA